MAVRILNVLLEGYPHIPFDSLWGFKVWEQCSENLESYVDLNCIIYYFEDHPIYSEWLIMVSKSPSRGYSPSKSPKWLTKIGVTNRLVTGMFLQAAVMLSLGWINNYCQDLIQVLKQYFKGDIHEERSFHNQNVHKTCPWQKSSMSSWTSSLRSPSPNIGEYKDYVNPLSSTPELGFHVGIDMMLIDF